MCKTSCLLKQRQTQKYKITDQNAKTDFIKRHNINPNAYTICTKGIYFEITPNLSIFVSTILHHIKTMNLLEQKVLLLGKL